MDHADQLRARKEIFDFDENDVPVILAFFLDVMLYQPRTARDDEEPRFPGLSELAVEEVTNKGKVNWGLATLRDAKVR
jgi:proteasome component ECM29